MKDMKLNRPPFVDLIEGDFKNPAKRWDVIQLKYDGWWGQLILDGLSWRLYSRTGMLKKSGSLNSPSKLSIIHSEFVYGTEWAKDNPELYDKLAIHSAELIDGVDVRKFSNDKVRDLLKLKIESLRFEKIEKGLFLVDQFFSSAAEEIWDSYVIGQSFEGIVFKNSKAPWGSTLGRMKKSVTMDYVCLGFEQSDSGSYSGRGVRSVIGGLCFNGSSTPSKACRVSGLTDDQRVEFYNNPGKYIGKVFEASGKKVSKKGALRHPSFERWRDDKFSEDCTWMKF